MVLLRGKLQSMPTKINRILVHELTNLTFPPGWSGLSVGQWSWFRSYNPQQTSCHTLQYLSGNLSVCPLPPVQCCLSRWSCHCSFTTLYGKGVAHSSDAIRYCPQNTLSAYFHAIWSKCAKNFCCGLSRFFRQAYCCYLAQAYKVYEEAAGKGIFMSPLQRSLYNADTPLTARPWWTPVQTGYERAIR